MKVLLTGSTGVIGRRATHRLLAAGHDVTAVARHSSRVDAVADTGARPTVVDLFDPVAVHRAVAGHDAVVHLATRIPPTSRSGRRRAWADNDRLRTEASTHLADAAIEAGAEVFVQESLAFLYPDRGDAWIDEDVETATSAVTASTATAEANADRVTEAGGRGVVLRFGELLAPDSGHCLDRLRAARRGLALVLGRTDGYFPAVTADDAAAAVVAALGAPAGRWNVVDDEPLTRAEVITTLAGLVGRERLHAPPRAVRVLGGSKVAPLYRSQRVANGRFRDATGWAPVTPSAREAWAAIAASQPVDVT